MPKETMFSNTAMMVERAAKDMKTKKSAPNTRPPGISLKILGRVTKTRPGPCAESTPNAEQAGKMIRPAISATKVSSSVMLIDSPVRERSLPM